MQGAIREQIPRIEEESMACRVLQGESFGMPWHFHPELELTLCLRSSGHRIVGDNITTLRPGDLVLVGSNLPHVWFQERGAGVLHAIVVQFPPDFPGGSLLTRAEYLPLAQLYRRADRGLCIRGKMAEEAADRLRTISEAAPLRRIAELLSLLEELSRSDSLEPICSPGYVRPNDLGDQARVGRVMQYIHEHLREPLTREAAARVAALSQSAFSRFFKARTGKTFPAYLNELRLGRAARLLTETEHRVADIARDCGFANLSHFNQLFLKWKRLTPRGFRERLRRDMR